MQSSSWNSDFSLSECDGELTLLNDCCKSGSDVYMFSVPTAIVSSYYIMLPVSHCSVVSTGLSVGHLDSLCVGWVGKVWRSMDDFCSELL